VIARHKIIVKIDGFISYARLFAEKGIVPSVIGVIRHAIVVFPLDQGKSLARSVPYLQSANIRQAVDSQVIVLRWIENDFLVFVYLKQTEGG
jgi:hypothetical protein